MKVNDVVSSVKGHALAAGIVLGTSLSALVPIVSYAADADASVSVGSAVGLVTSVSALFSTYPMNVFLGFGLAGAAISLFVRAKRGSGGR